uniref:PNPLA domain-containing protein n=1 Tax=viral metagenome TaxID=1070528 RepID=A0A6C0KFB5_9ZZZZ
MYDTIILSGGGTKGLCSLGSLQYLQDTKRIDCSAVNVMVGTSIGAIICYFLAIGYSPIELVVYLCSHSVLESLVINNFEQIVSGEGIYDYQILRNVYEKMTLEKMDRIPTLQDVYTQFGKELVICTYNFTDRTPEHISYKSHPDLSCLDALRMSSNLPFIFSTFLYNGKEYIDGGVIENFSFSMAKSLLQAENPKKIVGIYLDNKIVESSDTTEYNRLTPILDKIYAMLMIPVCEHEKQMVNAIANNPNIDFITVHVKHVKIYTFKLPHSDKLELFSLGYNRTKEFYNSHNDK